MVYVKETLTPINLLCTLMKSASEFFKSAISFLRFSAVKIVMAHTLKMQQKEKLFELFHPFNAAGENSQLKLKEFFLFPDFSLFEERVNL